MLGQPPPTNVGPPLLPHIGKWTISADGLVSVVWPPPHCRLTPRRAGSRLSPWDLGGILTLAPPHRNPSVADPHFLSPLPRRSFPLSISPTLCTCLL